MNPSFRGHRLACRSVFHVLCCAVAAWTLAACSGAVGAGNAPRNLVITAPGSAAPLTTLRMFQCLTSSVGSLLYFQDNSYGIFTNRVSWSSSNPGAVVVSNGDIAIPDGEGYYARGTLIPVGAGTAIVTANYYGIIAQLAVSVGTPDSITIKSVLEGNYLPLSQYNIGGSVNGSNSFSMGRGTNIQLAVTAELDGVETDITKYAALGFQDPGSAYGIAEIPAGTSLLTATGIGGPLVPVANFATCSLNNITNPANTISLFTTEVQGISLQTEFPGNPPLAVGNTERIDVIAALANGDQQNISSQSSLTSSNSSVAAFGGVGGANILSAASVGGTELSATFSGGGTELTATSVPASTETLNLESISICWSAVSLSQFQGCPASQADPDVVAGTLTPVQFHAIGNYGTDVTGNPIIQEVTRQTQWLVSNLSVASISSTGLTVGQALGLAQGQTQITATDTNAADISRVYGLLIVQPPPADCPTNSVGCNN